MKPLRIAAIFLIIGAGLVSSYLIVKSSFSLPSGQAQGQEISGNNQLNQNPIKWIEDKIQAINNSSSSAENNIENNTGDGNGTSTNNLTQLVAGNLFDRMKGLDAGGQDPFNGQNFDVNDAQNQELIQKSLTDMQSNPSALFDAKVEITDLRISQDNSQKAKSDYLMTINDISQARLGDPEYQLTEDDIINNFNSDCSASNKYSINLKIAGAYADAAEDYLKVYVPSDWVELHGKIIAYFKKANLIYSALANCFDDPIKGYLASQVLPQFFSENGNIQNSLIDEVKQAGL